MAYDTQALTPTQPSRFQRVRDALSDPVFQEQAKRIGLEVGGVALKGALESTGIARTDRNGDMRFRPAEAVRAAFSPKETLQVAASGAAEATRNYAQEHAVAMARQKLSDIYSGNLPEPNMTVPTTPSPAE